MLRQFRHRLTSLSRTWRVWNATVATEIQTEEDKTYIQRIAPNTKAAKTWLYQAWPKNSIQGIDRLHLRGIYDYLFIPGDGSSVVFPVINFQREQLRTIILGGDVFNVPVRKDILHRVVRWQRAKKQQGTHKTKTRAEVRGGGRKPWRQKGLGRARQGSIRAPHWRGGGKAHGPKPRSHAHKLNKKVRRLGLKSALSAKAVENRMMVVDVIDAEVRKTKIFYARLLKLLEGAPRLSVLMVDGFEEAKRGILVRQASNNIQGVKLIPVQGANVYDILRYDILVMSEEAVHDITWFLRSTINR